MTKPKRNVSVLTRMALWAVVASGLGVGQVTMRAGTAPTLVFSSPENNAVNVISVLPMILSFDTDMAPQESVKWSANIDPAKVTYTWQGADTLMITYGQGGFPGLSSWPANATVTWALNPNANDANNFRDTSGNLLPVAQFSGAFSTGSTISTNGGSGGNTNSPCSQSSGPPFGFHVSKSVSYVQTDATTTVIDPEIGATFSASLILPAAVNMTAANLTTPSGSIAMDVIAAIPPFLTNTFADTFATNATQAGLDQAYPAGNYTVQITATPPGNGTVMLTADYPPIPHIQNFAMIQAIDPAADFNLSWDADVGAGANDFISLFITEVQGSVVFQAPNQCATPPIALPVTATSIVVPKGTFTAGKSYNMELSFYHGVSRDVPITTDAKGTSALAKSTKLTLQTTGGTGALTAPKFTQVLRAANGMVQLQIACMSQRTLTLESTLDLKSWLPVLTTNAPGASLTVTVPAGPSTFFRAGQQ